MAAAVLLPAACGGPAPTTAAPTTAAPTAGAPTAGPSAAAPPAGPPGTEGPTATVQPPGTPTYLSDLREVPSFHGNEFDHGVVGVLGGREFPRSSRTRFCKDRWQVALYKLRHPYSSFVATLGLDDRSDRSAVVRFEVLAGEEVVFAEEVGSGGSVVVDVPIRDAELVSLSATLVSTGPPCEAVAIWGGARLVT